MTFTLSSPVRIAAALGLIASVVLFGGMKMMGGGSDAPVAVHAINPHPFGLAKPAAMPNPAAAKPQKHATTAARLKPKAKPAAPAVDAR